LGKGVAVGVGVGVGVEVPELGQVPPKHSFPFSRLKQPVKSPTIRAEAISRGSFLIRYVVM
jgi:hypothetical protein